MQTALRSLLCASLCAALAQPVAAADDGWQHTLAVYAIAATIDGEAGVGPITADVDISFGDILDNLEGTAMFAYRGERGPWAVYADLNWMNLEADKGGIGPLGGTKAEAELDQLLLEAGGGYALSETLDVYGGLRYWDVDADVKVTTGGPLGVTLSGSTSEDWVDPLVGLRYLWPLNDKWQLVAKGDIGGFGVGSDFSWCVTASAQWAWTDHATLMFGLRFIDVDYEDGSGADRFMMDLTEGGPAAAFAWRF